MTINRNGYPAYFEVRSGRLNGRVYPTTKGNSPLGAWERGDILYALWEIADEKGNPWLAVRSWQYDHNGRMSDKIEPTGVLFAYAGLTKRVEEEGIGPLPPAGDSGALQEEPFNQLVFGAWPTPFYVVTQRFGARVEVYMKWGLKGHEGIDIKAPNRAPIYAVADGVVDKVVLERQKRHKLADGSWAGHNYGVHIKILHHGGHWETTYAHLDSVRVKKGDFVKAGDQIGFADNTGNSNGSHLHFNVKYKGGDSGPLAARLGHPKRKYDFLNPEPWLVDWASRNGQEITWPGG